ncbi:hypothetical protein H0266_17175 [Halobacillus locisalis]|uniref:DUF6449 domain-containing protein n=1 Tax=Halobacillus locisalis TaxID=220753 RepID=A0A838CWU6_9BACI|nr:DUF6449 domain-containing protein [Halobacillus locisalis]MBA2176622.1 hypothetical protein [Halobacillus locisalis]
MPSKTSLFRKELLKQDFRNVGWIGIVYLVGLLFLLPMNLVLSLPDMLHREPNEHGLFSRMFSYELQGLFLFVIPVLMGVFLMRYMHVRSSSDFMHSLPIRREKLFHYHLLSGLIFLTVPIIMTGLVLLLFIGTTDVSFFYSIGDLGYWILVMIGITVVVFMASVFVGTLTGLSAVQGVLTYILLLFPVGIYGLVAYNVGFFVTGISSDSVMLDNVQYYSPIVDVFGFTPALQGEQPLPVEYTSIAIYFGFSVLFYAVGLIAYKNRLLESASQAIAISWLKPIFIFGVSLCLALLSGLYFGESQGSYYGLVFGYIAGGSLGYLLSTMVIEKTWRVFSSAHWKAFGKYAATVSVVLVLLPVSFQPFEGFVPEQDDIKGVFVGDGYYEYRRVLQSDHSNLMQSEEAIAATRELHSELIDRAEPFSESKNRHFIVYQLENGKSVYRSYFFDREKVQENFKQLAATKEYKELRYPITQLSLSEVLGVNLAPKLVPDTDVNLFDKQKLSEFWEVLKKDIYNLSYESMIKTNSAASTLYVQLKDREYNDRPGYNLSIDQSFMKTTEWLKEEGLYEKAFLQAEEIEKVDVYPWKPSYTSPLRAYRSIESEGNIQPFTLDGSDEIESLLRTEESWSHAEYLIVFYPNLKSGGSDERAISISASEAPDFIKQHFNE